MLAHTMVVLDIFFAWKESVKNSVLPSPGYQTHLIIPNSQSSNRAAVNPCLEQQAHSYCNLIYNHFKPLDMFNLFIEAFHKSVFNNSFQ